MSQANSMRWNKALPSPPAPLPSDGRGGLRISVLGGPAEGVKDVAVLVCVLEYWIAQIIIEFPASGRDDFLVAVERFVAGNEVEDRTLALTLTLSPKRGNWHACFNGEGGAEAGAAAAEREKAGLEISFHF